MHLYDDIQDAASELFAIAREAWDVESVVFENKAKATVLTVSDDWRPKKIVNEAEGTPELEISILPQDDVTETILRDSVRFVVLKGRRHEKRTYEYRTDAPERHQIRFQPIGEAV